MKHSETRAGENEKSEYRFDRRERKRTIRRLDNRQLQGSLQDMFPSS